MPSHHNEWTQAKQWIWVSYQVQKCLRKKKKEIKGVSHKCLSPRPVKKKRKSRGYAEWSWLESCDNGHLQYAQYRMIMYWEFGIGSFVAIVMIIVIMGATVTY